MNIIDDFKSILDEMGNKLDDFKNEHEHANKAISILIPKLPFPFDILGELLWDGLEKK